MKKIPQASLLDDRLDVQRIGWNGKPYFVEVSSYDVIYLMVSCVAGYKKVKSLHRGYICETSNPRTVQRVLKRYLRIAWKLNNKSLKEKPRYTRGIANQALESVGVQICK